MNNADQSKDEKINEKITKMKFFRMGKNYNFVKLISLLTTHIMKRSSYKEYREDALASGADEGRDKLR